MKEIFIRIKSNGIQPNLAQELKQNIEVCNIFNILDIFLVFPFIYLFRESPSASLLTAMPIFFHLLSFVLIRYHQYNLGRFIFSITTATAVYIIAALIYNNNGTDGMAAKFLIHGTIIMPFIVFTIKEWKYTLIALSLDLFYIISFNSANELLNLPNIPDVDSPELRMISIITTFIIFCSIFFYYKRFIIEQNVKLDNINKDLLAKNEELHELNVTKNKFFTIISHDLRGPLHAIHGCAKILKENHHTFDEEELKSFSKSFYNASKNTCNTVDNLLSWSHSQLNSLTIKPVTIELHDFVLEVVDSLKTTASMKEIQINNRINNDIYVHADKDIARVVLQNLLSNAIKYSYRRSTVTITARTLLNENKGTVEICVADTGLGMDSATVSKLFKIENTKSLTGTESEMGTGLGLLLSKEFAEKNQGEIYVESELGKGSKFYFTLLNSNS